MSKHASHTHNVYIITVHKTFAPVMSRTIIILVKRKANNTFDLTSLCYLYKQRTIDTSIAAHSKYLFLDIFLNIHSSMLPAGNENGGEMKRVSKKKLDEKWHRPKSDYSGQQCPSVLIRVLYHQITLLLLRISFISQNPIFDIAFSFPAIQIIWKLNPSDVYTCAYFDKIYMTFVAIMAIFIQLKILFTVHTVWLADIHVWSEYSPRIICNFLRSKYWCFDICTPCDRVYAYVHLCMIASMRN